MEKLSFKNAIDFVDYIIDQHKKLRKLSKCLNELDEFEDFDISIIAEYDEAAEIISQLILNGYKVKDINLSPVDTFGYDDEYVITLCGLVTTHDIYCEPMKKNDDYSHEYSIKSFILDNCSSKVIPYCHGKKVYEVSICEDEEDKNNDDEIGLSKGEEKYINYSKGLDGETHGFTASRSDGNSYYSYSFYTTDKLDTSDLSSLLKEYGF